MKHSLEPWEAEKVPDENGGSYHAIFADMAGVDRYGVVVDTLNRDSLIDPDEDRANALLIAAGPDLLSACRDQIAWIERLLQTLEHRAVYDQRSNPVNGFAFAPVPDWELRQKLESLKEDVAKATGEEAKP